MRSISISFLLAITLIHTIYSQRVSNDERLRSLDSLINIVIKDWKVTGLAVGVVEKDRIIYAKGFGYRDYERKLPVTINTVFPIASCTKAFTAALLGFLCQDGKLDLNQPVHNYYPELQFYNDFLTNNVTAKDMLTHRTGLPRHDWLSHSKNWLSMDSLTKLIRYLEPSAGFREKVQYNNLMYIALGALTQKLSGKTWEENLRERILKKLDMKNTTCYTADMQSNPDHSLGYYEKNDVNTPGQMDSLEKANPAGSINSNIIDMSNWLITWINGGVFRGQQVIPADYVKEAMTPQMSTPARLNPKYPDLHFEDIGYGWVMNSFRGHYRVGHGGDLPMFSSTVCFFPTDSVGIIVLVNRFNSSIAEIIRDHVAEKLFSLPLTDNNKIILALQNNNDKSGQKYKPAEKSIEHPMTHKPEDYTGKYIHPGYGTIEIHNQNDSLYATYNELPMYLKHYSYDIFRAGVPGGKIKFLMDAEGIITSITAMLEPKVSDIIFKKEKSIKK